MPLVEGQGDGVGLDHGEDKPVGEDQHGGEDDTHTSTEPGGPAAGAPQAQTALHVVGRAPAENAVGGPNLEDLGERRLGEVGRYAEQSDNPHPEQSPRAPEGDCERDPGDITGAHASAQPDDEGLEARQAAALVARARHQVHGPPEQAHLNAAGADRQVQADCEQKPDEDPAGDEFFEGGQALGQLGAGQGREEHVRSGCCGHSGHDDSVYRVVSNGAGRSQCRAIGFATRGGLGLRDAAGAPAVAPTAG